jgi:Domain of unknown function (DUF1330)
MQTPSRRAEASPDGSSAGGPGLYGKIETLEGPSTEGAVILKFPTVDAAKDWYSSPVYQDVARHRFLGADYRVFVVEGLEAVFGKALTGGASGSLLSTKRYPARSA